MRLLQLVEQFMHRTPRGRVLFCSHTRAAAQEALSRFPVAQAERIDIQTLHSVCFRALKMSKAQTVDEDKLNTFGQAFGIDMSKDGLGPEFIQVLSLSRARLISPEDGYERSLRPGSPSHFTAFATSYRNWKDQYGYFDFDDMLTVGAAALRRNVVDYALVVIDEAQDLTPLHWRVIYKLVDLLPGTQFLVAGDDDQALYTFTGAEPQGMADFGNATLSDFEVLSQSYRVPKQAYDLAQAIIQRVPNRFPKEYRPRQGPGGAPAAGEYEFLPHMDYITDHLSRTRDSLVMFNDRFVRAELEPIIQEAGYNYRALNGYPSPVDSRAGRALRAAHSNTVGDILDDPDADVLRSTIRNGLSARGQGGWDSGAEREILARIKRQDYSILSLKPEFYDYLRSVDFRAPQNVRISTFHGAKGLQGDDVHLVLTLSQAAWQEAAIVPEALHRLFYTAVTRTKDNLYIYDGENGYEIPVEWR